jgi:hypothetical protein
MFIKNIPTDKEIREEWAFKSVTMMTEETFEEFIDKFNMLSPVKIHNVTEYNELVDCYDRGEPMGMEPDTFLDMVESCGDAIMER